MRVGVISDTHGSVSEAALAALAGVDAIVHAGDVGNPSVLIELESIAPVTAVRGNSDAQGPLSRLPLIARVKLGGSRFLITHMRQVVARALSQEAADVVVTGHTHHAEIEEREGVLWVNPGSASWARSGGGHSVAVVETGDGRPRAEIIPL